MAVAAYLFIQYAGVMIAVLLLFALSFDVGVGWLLQQPTRRSFWLTIVFTSFAVIGGAMVVSIEVLRGHWVDTIKELLKELLHS
jgi:glycopeptide antibiotics resistance protein